VLECEIQGDVDGYVRIRHSGRQRRFVSVLEFDIQGDIDSMLEFDIMDYMTRFRTILQTIRCLRIWGS
jgi:hypothetical protein